VTALQRFSADTFRSLHVRNFRLFFGGQFISQVGNWLTLVAQTLLVLRLTDSGVALGLLAAAQFGPVLVLGAYAGLLADRMDKRRLLIAVQGFAMLQSFVLAALAFTDNPPVMAIYVVALFGGVATAFDNPARRAFVAEMVPPDQIQNAVSLNSAMMTGSRVIGPALAGLSVSTIGFGWSFLLDGLSYVAVIFGLYRMNPAELRAAPLAVRGKGQIREGLRYVRGVPDLWVPLVMMTLIGTLAFNFHTVLPLYATRDLGGGDLTFTLLMSVMSVGSLIGALAAARRTTAGLRAVSWTASGFGLTMALLAVSPNPVMAYVTALLVGLTSIAFMTTCTAIVQMRAEPTMRGRVLALQAIVFLGSTPIGGPITGTLAEQVGARWAMGLGAVAALVAGAYGFANHRRAEAVLLTEAGAVQAVDEAADLTVRIPA
jgi:MFS family permease